MNSQDDREWPDVERRESERRDPGPPQHVTVDGLSNGARLLVETLVEETREMKRDVTRELNEARKSVAKWAAGAVMTLGLALGGSIWGAAVWSKDIEHRAGVALDVREYVEQRTNELANEIAANGAADELTRSSALRNAAEFSAELESLRRDIDRIDADHRTEDR